MRPDEAGDIPLPPMAFIKMAAGNFQMGSPVEEVERWEDEVLHTVTISKEFEIQSTEVTQEQWFALMKSNPSEFRKRAHCPSEFIEKIRTTLCPTLPVDMISWDDAQEFIKKMNERRDGFIYRLPTEAEWEYAARAGSSTAYVSGNDIRNLGDFAWFEANSNRQTHPVASKKPTRNGLYDVHGNVWEWVHDWHDAIPPGSQVDPTGPIKGESRIIRGGSWGNDAYGTRLANRGLATPAVRSIGVGFRLVRTVGKEFISQNSPDEPIHLSRADGNLLIESKSKTVTVSLPEFKSLIKAALAVPSDYSQEIRLKFEQHKLGRLHDTTGLMRSISRMRSFVLDQKDINTSKLKHQLDTLAKKGAHKATFPQAIHEANTLSGTLVDKIYENPKFQRRIDPKSQTKFEFNIARSYLRTPRIGANFKKIPAGVFQMGSPLTEVDRDDNEIEHTVTISKNFEMQETKVTQSQWLDVMGFNPSEFSERENCPADFVEIDGESACPRHPVESVSWEDVQIFIRRLNESGDGFNYRLPTEAEREYAARARTQTTYFYGADIRGLQEVAWYFENAGDSTRPVRAKKPNAFGLYDVHGNVWEWIQDWYGAYPSTPRRDPTGPNHGIYRSIRGGSWFSVAKYLRSANRGNAAVTSRSGIIGLRLVRTK